MRRCALISVMMCVILTAGGCRTADYLGPETVCSLHHVEMESRTIPIRYGLLAVGGEFAVHSPGYIAPSNELWPNAPTFVVGGCCEGSKTSARVRVCPECERERVAWAEAHPAD